MAVTFRILKSQGVVFVKYTGHAILSDASRVFGDYAAHPDCAPGQKQLIDLSGITGWDQDFVQLLKFQAQKADAFMGKGAETLIVYYAPTKVSQSIAQIAMQAWEPFPSVVPIVIEDEAESLNVLGLPFQSFEKMLATAH